MYIQNYEELSGACQEQAEDVGGLAESIFKYNGNPPPHLLKTFRLGLMALSAASNRPIEVCDVRGEIWINIRERKPIPKEAIEQFIMGSQPRTAEQPANMADRIRTVWNWG